MKEEHAMSIGDDCCNIERRHVLGLGGLGAVALAGGLSFAVPAGAQALTQAQRDALTPEQVLKLVYEGNTRFISGQRKTRDWLAEQRATAAGQYPTAIFLSCVDSRAPVEVICDLGIGEAFNARIAGNAENDDILGSMEFATAAAGAKLVMVMGHSACGAIKGAIDNVRLGNLTLLLARFGNAIAETDKGFTGERTSKNPDYVNAVARTNVALTIGQIRERSSVMRNLERAGKIMIAGSFYDLATGRVTEVRAPA
jgi:carbonic anhydrase